MKFLIIGNIKRWLEKVQKKILLRNEIDQGLLSNFDQESLSNSKRTLVSIKVLSKN